MASIGSLGVGSGLDLNGLLDKISASERAPLNAIKNRQSAYNAKISAYGTLRGMLSTLQSAADKLATPDFMNGYKATSGSTDVLTVTSASTAVAGTYTVDVSKLAQSQSLVTEGTVTDAGADIGATDATITINFGTVTGTLNATSGKYGDGATFVPDATQDAITVSLTAGATSLEDVRDAINDAAAGAVTASIINDGQSHRLVLTSTATGAASSMEISVAGNGSLQSLLGQDMSLTATQGLRQTVEAQNAALKVNGIDVTGTSNTVEEAMQGVTMTLLDTGTSTVKVERDKSAVETAINDFVTAYNKLNAKIKDMTAYNSDKEQGSVLTGDNTTRVIQSRLRDALFDAVGGVAAGDPSLLSDLGISAEKDGSLKVDSAALSEVLADNPDGVTYLFAGDADTDGLADSFSAAIDALTQDETGDDDDGLLTISTTYAKKAIDRLDEDYDRAADRIDAKIEIYRAQFSQLDSLMSNMSATSSYLSTQFAALAKQTSK